MITTRQSGTVYTSVRGYPVKLLLAAIADIGVGVAIACNPTSIWAVPIGIILIMFGMSLARIAGRQIIRTLRTFLS